MRMHIVEMAVNSLPANAVMNRMPQGRKKDQALADS